MCALTSVKWSVCKSETIHHGKQVDYTHVHTHTHTQNHHTKVYKTPTSPENTKIEQNFGTEGLHGWLDHAGFKPAWSSHTQCGSIIQGLIACFWRFWKVHMHAQTLIIHSVCWAVHTKWTKCQNKSIPAPSLACWKVFFSTYKRPIIYNVGEYINLHPQAHWDNYFGCNSEVIILLVVFTFWTTIRYWNKQTKEK